MHCSQNKVHVDVAKGLEEGMGRVGTDGEGDGEE